MTIEWVDEGDCWRATVDHGVFDKKGRRVGGVAQINVDDRPGTKTPGKFMVFTRPTRNGRSYGSPSDRVACETLEAAQAWAEINFQMQRSRYHRKFRGGSRWR